MEFLTMSRVINLKSDIIDCLDLSNEQIGEILRACEQLGNISVEYFCEEFIFQCDTEEEVVRLHDDNYLTNQFTSLNLFNNDTI